MKKNTYVIIACAIILLLIALRLLAAPYRLSGDCMEPAFKDGKLSFLNRLAPYLRNYKINDVVAFNYEDKAWIARIVALENSTLQLSEGKIEVNGIEQQDSGIKRSWAGWDYGTYAIERSL
ncbi:MAG: signal peptidase I [Candidatus Dependentiae bacterium]|nr:signal peptidase I [Candidatus Dependentiae bacterium]